MFQAIEPGLLQLPNLDVRQALSDISPQQRPQYSSNNTCPPVVSKSNMDVVKAVDTYITKMVSIPSAMKVLLLDVHTVREIHHNLHTTGLTQLVF